MYGYNVSVLYHYRVYISQLKSAFYYLNFTVYYPGENIACGFIDVLREKRHPV